MHERKKKRTRSILLQGKKIMLFPHKSNCRLFQRKGKEKVRSDPVGNKIELLNTVSRIPVQSARYRTNEAALYRV